MLDRVQSLSSSWKWNGYANLALAVIGQAAVDLRTRACLSAAEWLLSDDFTSMAEYLGLRPEQLKFEIFHYQFFEQENGPMMTKTFKLIRQKDVSGVSGTGTVAEGVVFQNGKTILCWTRVPHSVTVFNSLDEMLMVHGHAGNTQLHWDNCEVKVRSTFSRAAMSRISSREELEVE